MQDPKARKVIEGRPDGIYVGSAQDRRLVWYPCRAYDIVERHGYQTKLTSSDRGEIYNFAAIHPDVATASESEGKKIFHSFVIALFAAYIFA